MSEQSIDHTARYLTFRLEKEVFALNVLQVLEVLEMYSITKVPRAPEFMRGIINVRGSVIPVLDFRMKFGLSRAEETVDTRIIVMQIQLGEDTLVIGAIADAVDEVMEIEPDQIEPAPKIGGRWRSDFIRGIGKRDEEFIIILDIDRVFSADELTQIEDTEAGSERIREEKAA
jgi:purine-binding chemotaxis protein CheW